MTIKVEHLKSKEQFDEMTAFLTAALDDTYTIQPNLLWAMWEAEATTVIVKRDTNNSIEAIQIWNSTHDEIRGGQRVCFIKGEYGNTSGFEAARDIAFSMFKHGWRIV
jgi:hypothetical protein